tara:strand:+ start:272 stop:493 length:222 start_codon:yes stop_codon:yes gene_type:complete
MNSAIYILIFYVSLIFSMKNDINSWKHLSLEQKIGQMIMVRVNGNYYSHDNNYKKLLKKWINDYEVGGVITFG